MRNYCVMSTSLRNFVVRIHTCECPCYTPAVPSEAESFFDEIRRYTGFGAEDEQALQALHPHAAPHFARIADEFYARILRHPNASRVFSGPEQVQRLERTLQVWLERLLAGPWDREYYEQRCRIGRVHVEVHLPQRYMLTAMNLIRRSLDDIAAEAFRDDAPLLRAAGAAIAKIVDIELAIMLETYRDEYVGRVQRLERSERVELESRLAQAQARYMGIVENAAALVIATDVHQRVLLFNSKAEQVSGFDRADVLGADCMSTICYPEAWDAGRAALVATGGGQHPAPFEARIVTRDGSERWVRWHLTSLVADEADLTCLIGIDVTEERNLERRTVRAEQLAGLGTLAAGLAHEIRNPLNAAQLQLMLVERRLARPGDDHRAAALTAARVVKGELGRLGGLVQDFLAFARPSELRLRTGDLAATLANVAHLVAPAAEHAGVSLVEPSRARVVTAMFDEERIKQVLLNLVRNAVEAAGRGGEVRLDLTVDAGTDRTTILVEDTGPGLPADVNVFEPFATTKEGGTGLGLPIVHRIVTDHGGTVDVTRKNGRTIFAVTLPIAGP